MVKLHNYVLRKLSIILLVLLQANILLAQDAANGQKLFETNCSACHERENQLVGPALKGVTARWKDQNKLIQFVQNSQAIIASGDPYAVGLFNKFNQQIMPPQALTADQVKDVLAYIEGGSGGGGGGQETQPPAPQANFQVVPASSGFGQWLVYGIIILMVVIIILAFRILGGMKGKEADAAGGDITHTNEEETPTARLWNTLNAALFPLLLIVGLILGTYWYIDYAQFMMPEPASTQGQDIDFLHNLTAIITTIVLVLTHILLFYFTFRFRRAKGRKAFFYSHNNKLEFIWTSIPAVVLAGLVLYGFKIWRDATTMPEKDMIEVEAFAKQFEWRFRYPGPDGKLGRTNFLEINPSTNPLGLDFSDTASWDDFEATELHIPVNQEVLVHARSQDVIHSVYLPHFRAQVYAQPGMRNMLHFKPIYTTAEMRARIQNEKFDYELACNQICGSAHFNMRRVVVVDTEEDFRKWLTTDKEPLYKKFQAATPANTTPAQAPTPTSSH